MSNVLLATDSTDLHQRIHEATGGTVIAVPSHPLPVEPAHLLAQVEHQALPDILVIDATRSPHDALLLASRFESELPGTGVVLIGDAAELSLAALRVGVRDVIDPGTPIEELREAIGRVAQTVAIRRAQPVDPVTAMPIAQAPGRIITVLSPKGGAGKTTVATNLAIGLAEAAPGAVVLVDLDVQFGDVATALGIDPEYTLEDIAHGASLSDPIALKTHLALHPSGLSVICAPETPAAAESIGAEQVSALLAMLGRQFRYVVVDTAAGLGAHTLAALDHTTDPLLLSTFDVAGARGLAKEMATLRELGMLTNARQVVLNFADPRGGLSSADVEATIRSRVDLTIPHSKAVTASLNLGVPLVTQKPRDPFSKQVKKLLAYYAGAGSRRTNGRHRAAA